MNKERHISAARVKLTGKRFGYKAFIQHVSTHTKWQVETSKADQVETSQSPGPLYSFQFRITGLIYFDGSSKSSTGINEAELKPAEKRAVAFLLRADASDSDSEIVVNESDSSDGYADLGPP
jgi:hypothetical protein